MKVNILRYKPFQYILLHIVIGVLIYLNRNLSLLYSTFILIYFIYRYFKSKHKLQVVLNGAAYIAGAEVFIRMTKGFVFYETGKYSVILFMLFGMFAFGFKRKALVYIIFLLLLLPAVYITFLNIGFDESFRKSILFNLSGPLSLAFSAIFCYGRTIKLGSFLKILDAMLLPIVSMTVYLYLYTPSTQNIVFTANSNFATSGGFGPNQVATVLGLGVFILATRFFIPYKHKFYHWLMMALMAVMAYRALLTFSRGGVITAAVMATLFVFVFLRYGGVKQKAQSITRVVFIILGIAAVWLYSVLQTGGVLQNRYAGENTLGEDKDITTGRAEIIKEDLEGFEESPIFGLGVGMGKFFRLEQTGVEAAAHNEISRMLAEHGLFGIFALLLLIVIPGILFLINTKNLFILPMTAFWFLTVNHSAMRVALPGFIYGLGLLSIQYKAKRSNIKKSVKKKSLDKPNTIVTHA